MKAGMEQLQQYLTQNNIRQGSFAAAIGSSQSHVNDILSGRRSPSLKLAANIARETKGVVPIKAWPNLAAIFEVVRGAT